MRARSKRLSNEQTQHASCTHLLWRNTAWMTSLPPYTGMPHLRGNPVSGRLPYLQGDQLLHNMTEAAKLGGMCSFWINNQLMIAISDPDLIYEYKVHCQSRYTQSHHDYIDTLYGITVVNHYPQEIRRLYHTAFHTASYEELQAKLKFITGSYMDALLETRSINDAGAYFRFFALELAMKLFVGIDLDSSLGDQYQISNFLNELFIGTGRADQGLLFLNLLDGKSKKFNAHELRKIDDFNERMREKCYGLLIAPHEQSIERNQRMLVKSIWEVSRVMRRDSELTFDNLFPDLCLMLIGGAVLSVGDSFSIILKLIHEHQDVYHRLIDLLEYDEARGMGYMEQIIKEAFRLHPPVTVIPARTVEKAFSLNGVTIQPDDKVVISPYVIHHDPNIWPEPEKFDPDRFAPENVGSIKPGTYLAFGLGDRSCPGTKYGVDVLKTFIASLIMRFDFRLTNASVLKQMGPTTVTADKLHIELTPRAMTHSLKF